MVIVHSFLVAFLLLNKMMTNHNYIPTYICFLLLQHNTTGYTIYNRRLFDLRCQSFVTSHQRSHICCVPACCGLQSFLGLIQIYPLLGVSQVKILVMGKVHCHLEVQPKRKLLPSCFGLLPVAYHCCIMWVLLRKYKKDIYFAPIGH